MVKRIMRTFKLTRIAAVDRPCQEGAKATILKRAEDGDLYLAKAAGAADLPEAVEEYLKRAFTADERQAAAGSGAAMPDGSFPVKNRSDLRNAVHAIGRAKDPGKAKSHIIARARALDATSMLPTDWTAGKSIGGDLIYQINKAAPRALAEILSGIGEVEDAISAFETGAQKSAIEKLNGEIDLAKTAAIAAAWAIMDESGADEIDPLLRKNFGEYRLHALGVVANGGNSSKSAPPNGGLMKAIAKSLGLAEDATEAQITAALTKQADLLKASEVLAKMSAKHKAFHEGLSGKKADDFAAMSGDERDACMAKAAPPPPESPEAQITKGLAFRSDTGALLTKADFGTEAGFEFAKSQAAKLTAQALDIAKGKDDAALATFTKMAEGFNLVGAPAEVGTLLRDIAKHDDKLADGIEAILKTAQERIAKSKLFEEIGSNNKGFAKAVEAIDAKARELMKADAKLTIQKARILARTQNPDLAKSEAEESQKKAA